MDANFSFEEPLRVAVVGPLDFIKGIQWELNKKSARKIELFQWRIGENAWPANSSALLYFVEHGMQIPTNFFKNVAPPVAIAVFEAMNPQQVLALSQVGPWRMIPWEEGRQDRIAKFLLEDIGKTAGAQSEEKVLAQLKAWLREQGEFPTRLVWTNAPATWKGAREILLSVGGAPIIVGSLESTADLKLPLSGRGEWGLFQKAKHGLQFRSLLPQLPVQFFGDPSQLKAGDRLKIFDFNFELTGSAEWTSLKSFLRRNGHPLETTASSGPKTLAEAIREQIESGTSGELSIKSENRTGYLSIQDGYLEEATVGPISGLKALFRILSWGNPRTKFERFDRAVVFPTPIRLGPLEFQRAYERWKARVKTVKALWPPHQLRVVPNIKAYWDRTTWTTKDFMVFSTLCESERVFEVLNGCPLLDVEIVESLVNLRRDQMIHIQ